MTALTIAAFVLAADGLALALFYRHKLAGTRLRVKAEAHRADVAERTCDTIVGDGDRAFAAAQEAIDDLDARNARLTVERDQAIRRGEKAATAAMTDKMRERAEFLASLQAWQQLFFAAMLLPPPQRALPAGRTMPEVLPSGEHALAGDVLVQLDDVDSWDDLGAASLPTTNGTRPRTRTRKKAGQ